MCAGGSGLFLLSHRAELPVLSCITCGRVSGPRSGVKFLLSANTCRDCMLLLFCGVDGPRTIQPLLSQFLLQALTGQHFFALPLGIDDPIFSVCFCHVLDLVHSLTHI